MQGKKLSLRPVYSNGASGFFSSLAASSHAKVTQSLFSSLPFPEVVTVCRVVPRVLGGVSFV